MTPHSTEGGGHAGHPASTPRSCPECGAAWPDGKSCQDYFHRMLAWEWEDTRNLAVHHLMVLSYHLQHPSLYSPEGLDGAKQLLVDFLERGITPEEARHQNRGLADSGRREFKITGTEDRHATYDHSVHWTMTGADAIAAGVDRYCDSVRAWARSILEALKSSGNLR